MADRSKTADRRKRLIVRDDAPPAAVERAAFARAVQEGLQREPKDLSQLPGCDTTTAGVRDEIAELPDYYLVRAERQILRTHAGGIAARFRDAAPLLVELGSGEVSRVRALIASLLTRHGKLRHVTLAEQREGLEERAATLLDEFPRLTATCVVSDHGLGLREMRKIDTSPRLIAWLGSAVGRVDRAAATNALHDIGATMGRADVLLVGVDLRKDTRTLERAYNDSTKLMARRNLGVLARVNDELDADFDPSRFRYRVEYAEEPGRVDVQLASRRRQVVTIGALDMTVAFAKGETIVTETAFKYSPSEIDAVAGAAELVVQDRWYDRDGRFSLNLMRHVPPRRPRGPRR